MRPYSLGNPFVESTEIVPLAVVMPVESDVEPRMTSGVKLSNFRY